MGAGLSLHSLNERVCVCVCVCVLRLEARAWLKAVCGGDMVACGRSG